MATIKKQNKNKNDGTIYHHEVADLQAQLRELNQRLAAVTSYQQQQQSSNISNNNENKRKKTNNIRSNYQPPPPPPPSVPLPSKTKTKCFVPQSKPKEITVAKPIWGNPHHPPPPPPAKNLCQKVKKQQPKPPPPPSLPHLQQNNKMTAQTPLSPSARHSAGTKFTISTWKSPSPLSMTKPKPKPSSKTKGKITDDTSKSSKSNSSSTTTTTKKKTVRRVVRRPNTPRQASVGPKVLSDIKNCNCDPSSLKHTISKDRTAVMSTIRHRWYKFLPVTTPATKALPPTRGTRMTTSSSVGAAASRIKRNAPQTKPLPPPRNNKIVPGKIAVSGPNKATWSIPKQKSTNGTAKQQNENEKETMFKITTTTDASSGNVVNSRSKKAKPRAATPNMPPKKVDGAPTLPWMSKRLKPVPPPQPGTKAPPTTRGSVPAGTKTSPPKSEPPKKIMHTKSAMPVRPKPQNLLADIRKEGTTKSILKSTTNVNDNQRLNQTHASKESSSGPANASSSSSMTASRPQTLQEQLAAKVTSRVSKNVPSFSNKLNGQTTGQTKSLPVSTVSKGNCLVKNSHKLVPAGIDNGKTKKWNKTMTSPVSAAKVKAPIMNASQCARPPPRLNLLAEIQNNNLELKPTQPKKGQTTKHIARTAADNNDHPCNNDNNTGNKIMMTSKNDLLAGIRTGVELKKIVDTPQPGQQKEKSGINRNGDGDGHMSIMADIKAGVSLKTVAPPVEHDKSKKPPPNSLLAQLQARKEECLKRNKASYIDDSDDDDW